MSEASSNRRATVALGLFYACAYASVGITLPFLSQYLRALGLSGTHIGLVSVAYPLTSLLLPPAFGLMADRTRRGALILKLTSLGGALAFVPLLTTSREGAVAFWLVLAALFSSPVSMLADSLTLERLGPRASQYPRVRLWGSVGFIASATGFGFFYSGERAEPSPVIVAALAACALRFVASLPLRGSGAVGGGGGGSGVRLADVRALLADGRIRLLLLATGLHWLANSPYNMLFAVFLKDEGMAPAIAGLGMGAGVVAEVTVMAFFPALAQRFPARRLLAFSFAVSALRWALVALTRRADAMVALQLFHGFTFGAFMVASVTFVNAMAPPRLRATAQALFVSFTYGLGGVVGYLATGALYDALPSRQLFFGAAALELLPAVLVLLLPAAGRDGAEVIESVEVPP